jgi:hypothetical protein
MSLFIFDLCGHETLHLSESNPGPAVLSDVPLIGSLQFSVGKVEQALLKLDINKGPGQTSFSFPLRCLIFNRSLATSVFPEKWKLSFVTPVYKNVKRNDLVNYRGIAILSAIAKLVELLICRSMYEDLRSLISENQHGFMKGH